MAKAGDLPESKMSGIWSPQQLAEAVGYSRQAVIHSITGRGKYPRRLFAQKAGDLWLIPDDHAEVFMHWHRTGELLEEPPIPEKLYWCVKEIVDATGMSFTTVERAITGVRGAKRKYTYPPTLPAQKLGQHWLVKASDAEKYICEKRENK
jgi:hypothetical protein